MTRKVSGLISTGLRHSYRLANHLYKAAFPIYRPIYGAYKAYVDRAERQLLAGALSPGAVVADVGANIGVYSEFLSRCVGPEGTVHSFEPSPDNFRRLRERLGGIANVQLNQLAVGDKSGESSLYLSDELNVDHRTYPVGTDFREAIQIQSIALDDYFKPEQRVDLIKMDVQGFELKALRGAERVLTENIEIMLLLEFWPYGLHQAGDSAEQLLGFLSEREFSFFQFVQKELKQCEPKTGDENDADAYVNLFVKRIRENAMAD
jgi:FkbM family methyltransferase